MKITIDTNFANTSTSVHILAENEMEALNPIPLLERAIEDLQWQIDNYHLCPYHAAG